MTGTMRNESKNDIDANVPEEMEVERYELRERPRYRFAANRREFAQTVGLGVLVTASATTASTTTVLAQRRRGRTSRRDETLAERFHLGADGVVTVLTGKVDVGQGSRTQIAQAAAEELGLPVDRLRVVMADSARCPDDGGTAGSRTTPSTVPRVRNAAAGLRTWLLQRVAEHWGTSIDAVRFRDGTFQTEGGRRLSLAEVAGDAFGLELDKATPPADAELKPVHQWTILGSSVPRLSGPDVVTGKKEFPSDVRRPGMAYGKVLRPPAYGVELLSIDLDKVRESHPDVTIVHDGNFVGCVASTSWKAQQVCDALARNCTWSEPGRSSRTQLFDQFREDGRRGRRNDGDSWGDGPAAVDASARRLAADYTVAYVQHAPMEPRAAVAEWNRDSLTVWTGTQQPSRVQRELSDAFRMPSSRVRLVAGTAGGGFGGKHTGEAAVEAARLAKAAGCAVSLRWTREEEFTWAYFRPAGLIEVKAGLDPEGNLHSWDFTNYNSGGSAIETPYRVPHGRTRFVGVDTPLRQGSYRALASTANTFARESAMDELAAMADQDPLAFRLRHLAEGRLKDVLVAAAERFGWAARRAATTENRGIGLACGTEKGSFVAACVEVDLSGDAPKIVEVCQAFECGAVQNPVNLRSQCVGSLMMGLGPALFEEIAFANGRITNASFSSYRVPRMRDLPKLDLVQLDRTDLPSVGAGETPIIAIAPAIANAVFHASGMRSRSMPLKLA